MTSIPPKKSLVTKRTSSNSEEASQSSNGSVNDSAIMHTLTGILPTYDGRGEPQKLHEFIQKHDNFFTVANLSPALVLVLASSKLMGPVYLWGCNHISKYDIDNEECIGMWDELKEELKVMFILPESEIAILAQLKSLTQNTMSVSDYNSKFTQLTMQVFL